ncbi:hypothetical protein BU14_0144s0027 [Porphyra umbilicalis]|uniref:Uncharacterized protein n=1 Tax=Porphyra umbilicalis TaxID=2786 RepID=A0A1X6P9J6_PORUM|nr:hypothetical protein BU14_0144s0027 [Porphyra umbilicalis]|eukprot:OSX77562.1 hypothetical protein BU14_0144s0027 [Porphyra umbilicalis]
MVSLKWAAAAAVAAATVTGVNFAGYFPSEDVSMQARVDLDIKAMMDAGTIGPPPAGYGAGLAKIQDWSTRFNKAGLQRTEPAAIAGRAFWGDWDFANRHLLAVLDGKNSPKYGLYRTGAWARTNAARKEMVEKLTKYTFVPLQKEEEAPEHWDEAWAYYAGSLEKGSGNGFSAYALAEKRAKNFGTMAAGRSSVNRRILRAMNAGKRQRVRQQVFLSGVKRPNWPIVRAAFGASTLNKMGIRCADSPKAAHPVCKDGKLTNNLAGTNFC